MHAAKNKVDAEVPADAPQVARTNAADEEGVAITTETVVLSSDRADAPVVATKPVQQNAAPSTNTAAVANNNNNNKAGQTKKNNKVKAIKNNAATLMKRSHDDDMEVVNVRANPVRILGFNHQQQQERAIRAIMSTRLPAPLY
ncbi:hypothetical protein GQ42DRAFT_165515 [Ramicandelaber brevisporus]|nr:hypothetical protein GQ42DRAFT_165515 [Ramicandelaber brevisporus]